MNLISLLRKIAVAFEAKNENDFKLSVTEQKKYLEHLPEPKNDIERSYYQYCCQMHFYNPLLRVVINIASLPLYVLYIFKRGDEIEPKKSNCVFFADGKPENIIPNELRNRVGEIEVIEEKKEYLTKEDKEFIKSIMKRYPLSWYFLLKCIMKVRFYSYQIQKCRPQNIIVCNEYSFTSSLLTEYCESLGIRHINVMHGEKYYYIRDSFFRFHDCYVWDEYYKRLFQKLRAKSGQFVIAVPPSLKIQNRGVKKEIDYTYYLSDESGDKLNKIITSLLQLYQNGYIVALRPHPRYSNTDEMKVISKELLIEDFKQLTIEQSILRTRHVISLCSTVLNQAYNSDIDVIIDDINDTERYEKLDELGYIMLKKKHKLLSEVLNRGGNI